jgi:serine protease Do
MNSSEPVKQVGAGAATPVRRPSRRALALAAGAAMLGITLGAGFVQFGPEAVQAAQAQLEQQQLAQAQPMSFADVVQAVQPAVVNISTMTKARGEEGPGRDFQFRFDLPEDSPFQEFFKQFEEQFRDRGDDRGEFRREGQGSGFIIDPEGYVVTNNHVVDGAETVTVTMNNGDEYTAEVVGTDGKTDLALLKIATDKQLPALHWGDSDRVRVGDWVLAVGNPFGLGGTVTAGIVSARERNINAGPFDEFLQVDAPINQGNSGGPLFDPDGGVIGVNTAIFSPSGGSVGIGFAIPSSIAKGVIEQLRETGTVERGWLGVQIQLVTPEIASAVGLDSDKGALVASVQPDSPASKAELQQGDVILKVDGQDVAEMKQLPRIIAGLSSGHDAQLTVWRDGKEVSVPVTIGQMEQDQVASVDTVDPEAEAETSSSLGAELTALTPDVIEEFGLPEGTSGVVVVSVEPDSIAAEHGLRPGDIIESVSKTKVKTVDDVERLLAEAKEAKQEAVLLLVNRGGTSMYVAVKIEAA